MNTWLKMLPLELSEAGVDIFEPLEEIDPKSEKRIGVMDEDQKKLYSMWRHYAKESEKFLLEAKYAGKEEKARESIAKYEEFSRKAFVLVELFWISLRDQYNHWGGDEDIAIRRGFLVVATRRSLQGPKIIGIGFGPF